MAKNANFVSHKKSKQIVDGKPKLPLASDIVEGEIAINFGKDVETLSIKNESGDVVTFSSDNYYTEKKLGSGFTGANSAKTVTEVIDNLDLGNEVEISSGETPTEETVELWVDTSVSPIPVEVYTKAETDSLLLTKVNTSDVVQNINSETSASTNPVATSAVYNFVTAHTPTIEIDQVIDSGTSASTDAVSTSAVYGFVTSYTPSITVDQVLDNTTSASTNPVSSKAVYDAVTDNELVWTNAYVTLSGVVSSHTVNTNIHLADGDREKINSIDTLSGTVTAHTANTEIHVTTADKEKLHTHSNKTALDSITGNVGTMAYQNANSYSSATEVNSALGGKSDTATTYTKTEVDARDLWVSGTGTSSVAQKGGNNTASGNYSHAEGSHTKANGSSSHAEGYYTTASGQSSHAEGYNTTASGTSSHAEGMSTKANGGYSHAEGQNTIASGESSHAEGFNTTANGYASHAEGYNTTASGQSSHAEGEGTKANNQSEHASGQYNVSSKASSTFGDGGNTLFSVGNGTASNARHNAFEIRQNGDIYIVSGGTDIKLQDNIGKVDVISAITPSNSGSTAPIATKVVAENELTVSNALNELESKKLDASAYTPTDLSDYYTSAQTEAAISSAISGKVDTNTFDTIVGSGYTNTTITEVIENMDNAIAAALTDLNDKIGDIETILATI